MTLEPGFDVNPTWSSPEDGPGTYSTWLDHVAFAELSVLLGFATNCELLELVVTGMEVREKKEPLNHGKDLTIDLVK